MRLDIGDKMPEELAQRKQEVLATLIELQQEVEPVTKATELLKDSDVVKDSKAFVAALTKDFGVNINTLPVNSNYISKLICN